QDLLADEEPEAEPLRSVYAPRAASHGLEERRQQRGGNGSMIVHLDADMIASRSIDAHAASLLGDPVLDGIGEQIGKYLGQAVCVPVAGRVAGGLYAKGAFGAGVSDLVGDLAQQRQEIARTALERDAAAAA